MCYISFTQPTPIKAFRPLKYRHAEPPPDHPGAREPANPRNRQPPRQSPGHRHVPSLPTPTATTAWQPRTQSHKHSPVDAPPNSHHDHCPQTCCQINVLVTFSPPKATNISYASVALRLQDQHIPSDHEFRLNIKKTNPSPRTDELVVFSLVSIAIGVPLIVTTPQL